MKTIKVTDEQYTTLCKMQEELKTQDTRGTANPVYGFMEKVREYGKDTDYADKYIWVVGGIEPYEEDIDLALYLCEDREDQIKQIAIEHLDYSPDVFKDLDEEGLEKECVEIVLSVLQDYFALFDIYDFSKILGIDISLCYYTEIDKMYEYSVSLFESDIDAHVKMNWHNMHNVKSKKGFVFSNRRTPRMEALRDIIFGIDLTQE